jgi:hypothetical protein
MNNQIGVVMVSADRIDSKGSFVLRVEYRHARKPVDLIM